MQESNHPSTIKGSGMQEEGADDFDHLTTLQLPQRLLNSQYLAAEERMFFFMVKEVQKEVVQLGKCKFSRTPIISNLRTFKFKSKQGILDLHLKCQGALSTLLILSSAYSAIAQVNDHGSPLFNVMHYGAIGDGRTDDSEAFMKAWGATCKSEAIRPTMVIPNRKKFLLRPLVTFRGPCLSTNVHVQIMGNVIAPEEMDAWKGVDPREWLSFRGVNGLTLSGSGAIDGRGSLWWHMSCKFNMSPGCTALAPSLVSFFSCRRVQVRDLKFMNSPNNHIHLEDCSRVMVNNIYIKAPSNSPNTDGIHIQASHNVNLYQLSIRTGDDCISIGDRTSDVQISRVWCGPGHGISIGSLGKDNRDMVEVRDIHVRHAHFYRTTNGARIKTWQGAYGYAKNISFEDLRFVSVDNPIIIDQYYCDLYRSCTNQTAGVKISDVVYENAYGTSSSDTAINLKCSETVACSGIHLQNVYLTSAADEQQDSANKKKLLAYCLNAHGTSRGIIKPVVPCLTRE